MKSQIITSVRLSGSGHKHQKNNYSNVSKTISTFVSALFLLVSTAVFAHNEPGSTFRGKIHASGTHFVTPPSDSWVNTNSDASVEAAYQSYDGESFVTLVAYDKQTDVTLDFVVQVNKGALRLIVENSNNEIIFEKTFTDNAAMRTTLTLDVYEAYKIRFAGNQTKGAYVCKWTANQ